MLKITQQTGKLRVRTTGRFRIGGTYVPKTPTTTTTTTTDTGDTLITTTNTQTNTTVIETRDINGDIVSSETITTQSGETTSRIEYSDGYFETVVTNSSTNEVLSAFSEYPTNVEDASQTNVFTDYQNGTITTTTNYVDLSVLQTITDLEGVLLATITLSAPDETGVVTRTTTFADGSSVTILIDTDTTRSFRFDALLGDNLRIEETRVSAPDPITSNTITTEVLSNGEVRRTTKNHNGLTLTVALETVFDESNQNTNTIRNPAGTVLEVEYGTKQSNGDVSYLVKDDSDQHVRTRTVQTVNDVTTETVSTLDGQTLSQIVTESIEDGNTRVTEHRDNGYVIKNTFIPLNLRINTHVEDPIQNNQQVITDTEFTGTFSIETRDIESNEEIHHLQVITNRVTRSFISKTERSLEADGRVLEDNKNENDELLFSRSFVTQENGQVLITKSDPNGLVLSTGTSEVQQDGSVVTAEVDPDGTILSTTTVQTEPDSGQIRELVVQADSSFTETFTLPDQKTKVKTITKTAVFTDAHTTFSVQTDTETNQFIFTPDLTVLEIGKKYAFDPSLVTDFTLTNSSDEMVGQVNEDTGHHEVIISEEWSHLYIGEARYPIVYSTDYRFYNTTLTTTLHHETRETVMEVRNTEHELLQTIVREANGQLREEKPNAWIMKARPINPITKKVTRNRIQTNGTVIKEIVDEDNLSLFQETKQVTDTGIIIQTSLPDGSTESTLFDAQKTVIQQTTVSAPDPDTGFVSTVITDASQNVQTEITDTSGALIRRAQRTKLAEGLFEELEFSADDLSTPLFKTTITTLSDGSINSTKKDATTDTVLEIKTESTSPDGVVSVTTTDANLVVLEKTETVFNNGRRTKTTIKSDGSREVDVTNKYGIVLQKTQIVVDPLTKETTESITFADKRQKQIKKSVTGLVLKTVQLSRPDSKGKRQRKEIDSSGETKIQVINENNVVLEETSQSESIDTDGSLTKTVQNPDGSTTITKSDANNNTVLETITLSPLVQGKRLRTRMADNVTTVFYVDESNQQVGTKTTTTIQADFSQIIETLSADDTVLSTQTVAPPSLSGDVLKSTTNEDGSVTETLEKNDGSKVITTRDSNNQVLSTHTLSKPDPVTGNVSKTTTLYESLPDSYFNAPTNVSIQHDGGTHPERGGTRFEFQPITQGGSAQLMVTNRPYMLADSQNTNTINVLHQYIHGFYPTSVDRGWRVTFTVSGKTVLWFGMYSWYDNLISNLNRTGQDQLIYLLENMGATDIKVVGDFGARYENGDPMTWLSACFDTGTYTLKAFRSTWQKGTMTSDPNETLLQMLAIAHPKNSAVMKTAVTSSSLLSAPDAFGNVTEIVRNDDGTQTLTVYDRFDTIVSTEKVNAPSSGKGVLVFNERTGMRSTVPYQIPTTPWSYSGWIYFPSAENTTASAGHFMFKNGGAGSYWLSNRDTTNNKVLVRNYTGLLTYIRYDGKWTDETGDFWMSMDEWHHFARVYTPNQPGAVHHADNAWDVQIYLDGVLQRSATSKKWHSGITDRNFQLEFEPNTEYSHRFVTGGFDVHVKGLKCSNYAIWNTKALSAEDVTALYTAGYLGDHDLYSETNHFFTFVNSIQDTVGTALPLEVHWRDANNLITQSTEVPYDDRVRFEEVQSAGITKVIELPNGLRTESVYNEDDAFVQSTTTDSNGNTIQTVTVNHDGNWVTLHTPFGTPPLPAVESTTAPSPVSYSHTDGSINKGIMNAYNFKTITPGALNVQNFVNRNYFFSESDGNPYYNGKVGETFTGFLPGFADEQWRHNWTVSAPTIIAVCITANRYMEEYFNETWAVTGRSQYENNITRLSAQSGVEYIGVDSSNTLGRMAHRDNIATGPDLWLSTRLEENKYRWVFFKVQAGAYYWEFGNGMAMVAVVKKLPDTITRSSVAGTPTTSIQTPEGTLLYEEQANTDGSLTTTTYHQSGYKLQVATPTSTTLYSAPDANGSYTGTQSNSDGSTTVTSYDNNDNRLQSTTKLSAVGKRYIHSIPSNAALDGRATTSNLDYGDLYGNDFQKVYLTAQNTLLHMNDGTWSILGERRWGLFGDGFYSTSASSVVTTLTPQNVLNQFQHEIVQLALADTFLVLLAGDGKLYAMGNNGNANLGTGNTTQATQLVECTKLMQLIQNQPVKHVTATGGSIGVCVTDANGDDRLYFVGKDVFWHMGYNASAAANTIYSNGVSSTIMNNFIGSTYEVLQMVGSTYTMRYFLKNKATGESKWYVIGFVRKTTRAFGYYNRSYDEVKNPVECNFYTQLLNDHPDATLSIGYTWASTIFYLPDGTLYGIGDGANGAWGDDMAIGAYRNTLDYFTKLGKASYDSAYWQGKPPFETVLSSSNATLVVLKEPDIDQSSTVTYTLPDASGAYTEIVQNEDGSYTHNIKNAQGETTDTKQVSSPDSTGVYTETVSHPDGTTTVTTKNNLGQTTQFVTSGTQIVTTNKDLSDVTVNTSAYTSNVVHSPTLASIQHTSGANDFVNMRVDNAIIVMNPGNVYEFEFFTTYSRTDGSQWRSYAGILFGDNIKTTGTLNGIGGPRITTGDWGIQIFAGIWKYENAGNNPDYDFWSIDLQSSTQSWYIKPGANNVSLEPNQYIKFYRIDFPKYVRATVLQQDVRLEFFADAARTDLFIANNLSNLASNNKNNAFGPAMLASATELQIGLYHGTNMGGDRAIANFTEIASQPIHITTLVSLPDSSGHYTETTTNVDGGSTVVVKNANNEVMTTTTTTSPDSDGNFTETVTKFDGSSQVKTMNTPPSIPSDFDPLPTLTTKDIDSRLTTTYNTENTSVTLYSTEPTWLYVTFQQVLIMTVGNEYNFEMFWNATTGGRDWGGLLFGYDIRHEPNNTEIFHNVQFVHRYERTRGHEVNTPHQPDTFVWKTADGSLIDSTLSDHTNTKFTVTRFPLFWKLTVVQRDGFKDLKMEGFSNADRTTLVTWAYVSEMDRNNDQTLKSLTAGRDSLQYPYIYFGFMHNGASSDPDTIVLRNFTPIIESRPESNNTTVSTLVITAPDQTGKYTETLTNADGTVVVTTKDANDEVVLVVNKDAAGNATEVTPIPAPTHIVQWTNPVSSSTLTLDQTWNDTTYKYVEIQLDESIYFYVHDGHVLYQSVYDADTDTVTRTDIPTDKYQTFTEPGLYAFNCFASHASMSLVVHVLSPPRSVFAPALETYDTGVNIFNRLSSGNYETSYQMWIRFDGIPANLTTGRTNLLFSSIRYGFPFIDLAQQTLQTDPNAQIRMIFPRTGGNVGKTLTAFLPNQTWNHVVYVHSRGSWKLEIYVNGSRATYIDGYEQGYGGQDVYRGAFYSTWTSEDATIPRMNFNFPGMLCSNFAFFKKPLSADDVLALYDNGQGFLHTELPVPADNYWSFNNTLQEDASSVSFKNTTWNGTPHFLSI